LVLREQPDNVLVTEFLRAKLSDFGTSRAQGTDDDVAMTAVGTPLFCAPEILRGEAYDASADVYSFGLLLLAMVKHIYISCVVGGGGRPRKAHNTFTPHSKAHTQTWRPLL
jgi:serine/threonine protein kinase